MSQSNDERLHLAACQGDGAGIRAALEAGVDVNHRGSHGKTAAWDAAAHGYLELLDVLSAAGADFNIPNEHGISPMAWAIGEEEWSVAAKLKELGAKIDRKQFLALRQGLKETKRGTPQAPTPTPERLAQVGAIVAERFEDAYPEMDRGDKDLLDIDPNDFDLDPTGFYEDLADWFGLRESIGFEGPLRETVAKIALHWDGKASSRS